MCVLLAALPPWTRCRSSRVWLPRATVEVQTREVSRTRTDVAGRTQEHERARFVLSSSRRRPGAKTTPPHRRSRHAHGTIASHGRALVQWSRFKSARLLRCPQNIGHWPSCMGSRFQQSQDGDAGRLRGAELARRDLPDCIIQNDAVGFRLQAKVARGVEEAPCSILPLLPAFPDLIVDRRLECNFAWRTTPGACSCLMAQPRLERRFPARLPRWLAYESTPSWCPSPTATPSNSLHLPIPGAASSICASTCSSKTAAGTSRQSSA